MHFGNMRKLLMVCGAAFASIIFLWGCSSDESGNGGGPTLTAQDVEFNVRYSGTARCIPFETHALEFLISDPASSLETLIAFSAEASPDMVASGHVFKRSHISPGDYSLSVYWDWNDDQAWSSFEQVCSPEPQMFTVVGDKTERINVQMVDRTSPGSNAWIEGTVSYSGAHSGVHRLYVKVTDLDYNLIKENEVTLSHWGTSLERDYDYISQGLPAGGDLCYAVAYWDVNDNGTRDGGDPTAWYNGVFLRSPGLPTVGIDFALTD